MAASTDTLLFSDLASSLPISDRTRLVGLGDNDVRAWTMAKADEYRRFALALLSIYNAVAPIHRLPFEVLSTIFETCWRDRKSLRIAHVCRRWRSVLLNTSGFWADAVKRGRFALGDCSTGYLGVILERSAPRMVAPSFCRFSTLVSPCLAPHTARLVSLAVSLASHSELFALWLCLNSGMQCLETLTMALIDDPSWARTPQIHDETPYLSPTALPRLTRVTAPGCLLHCFPVPSLRHITLKNTNGQHIHVFYDRPESYESLRGCLEVCATSLESLVLLEVAPSRLYVGAPLSLPALRHLRIHDDAHRCALTLSRLVLPDTAYIDCTNTDSGRLCDTVPLDAAAIRTALSATHTVLVLSTADAMAVHCYAAAGDRRRLLLSIGFAKARFHARKALRADDLVQLLRHTAPVASLTVGPLDERDVQGADFRAFPHVLRVSIAGLQAGRLLGNLARRDDGGGGGGSGEDDSESHIPARAVCPELKTLAVDFQFECGEDGAGLGPALRDGPASAAVIEADFRARCAELERVLARRAELGAGRVTRLEFGCTEKKRAALSTAGSEAARMLTLQTGVSNKWAPWGTILEPLEKLVDGPVVVGGYRLFPEDDGEIQ